MQDHDDLTPLFTQQSDKLAATYGDYFLAELIEAQDEENHAVVCEVSSVNERQGSQWQFLDL